MKTNTLIETYVIINCLDKRINIIVQLTTSMGFSDKLTYSCVHAAVWAECNNNVFSFRTLVIHL